MSRTVADRDLGGHLTETQANRQRTLSDAVSAVLSALAEERDADALAVVDALGVTYQAKVKTLVGQRLVKAAADKEGHVGASARSILAVRGHVPVLQDGARFTCATCCRTARAVKLWGRWHLVGSGDRRTDLTAGRCAGVRAA